MARQVKVNTSNQMHELHNPCSHHPALVLMDLDDALTAGYTWAPCCDPARSSRSTRRSIPLTPPAPPVTPPPAPTDPRLIDLQVEKAKQDLELAKKQAEFELKKAQEEWDLAKIPKPPKPTDPIEAAKKQAELDATLQQLRIDQRKADNERAEQVEKARQQAEEHNLKMRKEDHEHAGKIVEDARIQREKDREEAVQNQIIGALQVGLATAATEIPQVIESVWTTGKSLIEEGLDEADTQLQAAIPKINVAVRQTEADFEDFFTNADTGLVKKTEDMKAKIRKPATRKPGFFERLFRK